MLLGGGLHPSSPVAQRTGAPPLGVHPRNPSGDERLVHVLHPVLRNGVPGLPDVVGTRPDPSPPDPALRRAGDPGIAAPPSGPELHPGPVGRMNCNGLSELMDLLVPVTT